MKFLILFSVLLASAAQASIVTDLTDALPTGIHNGRDCQVVVSAEESNFPKYHISIRNKDQILSTGFYAESTLFEVRDLEIKNRSTEIKFVNRPDDGYTGKDVVKLELSKRRVTLKIKDYGPLGIFRNTKEATCRLK